MTSFFPQSGRLPNGDETFHGAKLPIAHITRQMAGVYECVADNKLNIKAVGRISLQVQCEYGVITITTLISRSNSYAIYLSMSCSYVN